MNKLIALLLTILAIMSCESEPQIQNKRLTYQNIAIISDMSSRIRNTRFPQKDTEEIRKLLYYFKNECVRPGEKIGDRSSISFSAFSEKKLISIDLDQIKNLGDKQSFINSKGKYLNCGLNRKLVDLEDSVRSFYVRIANPGLDLISILTEKIENGGVVKHNRTISDGIDEVYLNFDNHIYIFTDGYLEYKASHKDLNGQYYFGIPEIQQIRKYCAKHNMALNQALEHNGSLGLPSSKCKENKYINLHIFETQERDKDTKFQTYSHPKGLRDNEILEAVWKKWAKESGFKSIDWKKY